MRKHSRACIRLTTTGMTMIALTMMALLTPAAAFPQPRPQHPRSQSPHPRPPRAYLGFDRNDYPGDASLPALRKSFAFTGYWLSRPPGGSVNSWHGKRATLERAGFGFLLLFNGRSYSELKSAANVVSADTASARIGASDGAAAARTARAEGFPRGSVIFLDQEQGGRMLPEQKRYIFAWADALRRDGFLPGIYCSGIEVAEPDGGVISTARDLHDSVQGRRLVFWVANDACPPSPGCRFPAGASHGVPNGVSYNAPPPQASGADFAEVWQFAQSPVRRQFAVACLKTYSPDGNCYPPGLPTSRGLHLDLNSARLADPSHARR